MKKSIIFLSLIFLFFLNGFTQNVGIGVTNPAAKLEVRHLSSITNPTLLLFDEHSANYSRLQFQNSSGPKYWTVAGILHNTVDASSRFNIYHSVYGDVMSLTGDGKVGIGIVPVEKLDVAGNIKATGSLKGSSYTFNSPKTYYYSLSGSDFLTKVSSRTVQRETVNGGGAFLENGTEGLTAAVHLPHGAVLTKITVFFLDNSSTADLHINLRRNFSTVQMAFFSSSGTPGETSMFDNSIFNSTIDNSLYAYTIDIDTNGADWPNVNLIVRKIILEYTVASL